MAESDLPLFCYKILHQPPLRPRQCIPVVRLAHFRKRLRCFHGKKWRVLPPRPCSPQPAMCPTSMMSVSVMCAWRADRHVASEISLIYFFAHRRLHAQLVIRLHIMGADAHGGRARVSTDDVSRFPSSFTVSVRLLATRTVVADM